MEYDYDMYYLRAKNKFTLHFANIAELSKEEIRDIFSEFGNIVSLTTSGDTRGMRFVSYATLRETINCIKNLKNHKKVKLLPERSKMQMNKDEGDDQTKTDAPNKKLPRRNRRNMAKQSSNTNNVVKSKEQSSEVSLSWGDESIKNREQAFEEIEYHNEQNDNEDSENNESSIKSFEISTRSKKVGKLSTSNIKPNKDLDKFHNFDYLNTHSDSASSSVKDNGSYINKIPSLISIGTSIHGTSVESLNESLSTRSTIKPKIVMAQHIVVANVHEDYSIHFILHLFHKYDPIAGSLMKKIPGTGIRYCHVYFKNPQDALKVEQKFDNYALNSKSLIVMRSDRLLEEV